MMLKLTEPIRLKLNTEIKTTSDTFAKKMMANYQIMNMTITSEEFLHFMMNPPEMYLVEGGVTMLVQENQINNRQTLNMELIYQMFNRLLINIEDDYTYQDKVFIEAILRKIGIADISIFIKQIQNTKQEQVSEKKIYQLYEQQMSHKQDIYEEIRNQTIQMLQLDSKYDSHNQQKYYLQDDIYNRLDTKQMYEMLYQYNSVDFTENDYHNQQAFQYVEEQQIANQIQVNQWKNQVLPPEFITYYPQNNIFEEGVLVTHFNMQDEIFSNLVSAIVSNVVKQMHFMNVTRFQGDHWFKTGYYLQEIAKNTFHRLEKSWYVAPKKEEQYIENISKKTALYQKELQFIESLFNNKVPSQEIAMEMVESVNQEEHYEMSMHEIAEQLTFIDINKLYKDYGKIETLHNHYPPLYTKLLELVEQEEIVGESSTIRENEMKELLTSILFDYEDEHLNIAIHTIANQHKHDELSIQNYVQETWEKHQEELEVYLANQKIDYHDEKQMTKVFNKQIVEEYEKSTSYLQWVSQHLQDEEEIEAEKVYTEEEWNTLAVHNIKQYIDTKGYQQYMKSYQPFLYNTMQQVVQRQEDTSQSFLKLKQLLYHTVELLDYNEQLVHNSIVYDGKDEQVRTFYKSMFSIANEHKHDELSIKNYVQEAWQEHQEELEVYLTNQKIDYNNETQMSIVFNKQIAEEYEKSTSYLQWVSQHLQDEAEIEAEKVYTEEEWNHLTIHQVKQYIEEKDYQQYMRFYQPFLYHIMQQVTQKQEDTSQSFLKLKQLLYHTVHLLDYNEQLIHNNTTYGGKDEQVIAFYKSMYSQYNENRNEIDIEKMTVQQLQSYFELEEQYYRTMIRNREQRIQQISKTYMEDNQEELVIIDTTNEEGNLYEENVTYFNHQQYIEVKNQQETFSQMNIELPEYSEEEWFALSVEEVKNVFHEQKLDYVVHQNQSMINHALSYLEDSTNTYNSDKISYIEKELYDVYQLIKYHTVLQKVEVETYNRLLKHDYLLQSVQNQNGEYHSYKEVFVNQSLQQNLRAVYEEELLESQLEWAYDLWNTQQTYEETYMLQESVTEQPRFYQSMITNILQKNDTYQEVIRNFEATPRVVHRLYDATYLEDLEEKINDEISDRKEKEVKRQIEEKQSVEQNTSIVQSVNYNQNTSATYDQRMIEKVIQSNLQKEISIITQQVYSKIEKKMENERKRRGF